MIYINLVKTILDNSGTILPIFIPSELTNGTGLCNTSLYYDGDKLRGIMRHVEYTLYSCEGEKKYQSRFEGPLSYYHRDDDLKLRTNNYYIEIDKNTFKLSRYNKIDTSLLDEEPKWTFIGLEDARLINWNNKFYACGVRRDTTTNGQGRMEMSELEISDNFVKEIKRNRIEPPIDKNSYCEKNWMPVKNKPNHFIKWSNPTEVVEIDISNNISKQVFVGDNLYLNKDLRGGSQLIKWDNDCYLAIVHSCDFISKNFNGYKDADYHHYFVIWNSDWSIQYISNPFNFMTGRVEFCIGLEQVDDNIIIAFSFQDNGSYLVKLSKNILDDILWNKLKPLICNIEKE